MIIFATILTWISSKLPWIGKLLLQGYQAKLGAENTTEKIAADLQARELAVEQRERELAASIVIAEQGNWFTRWVRPLWAAPFVIYTWKIVVWDKVLAIYTHGATDPLEGIASNLALTVAAAYFGGRTIENVVRLIKK